MNYLTPDEYEAYGLEATTSAAWIAAASALIDAHCRRPTLEVAQYRERPRLDCGRNTVRLSYLPLAPVAPAPTPFVTVQARYGVPRRGDGLGDAANEIAQAFSLPGSWTALDPATIEWSADTGEITLPANALGLTFNELDVTYNAGFGDLPGAVKVACAQIVRNAQATPALNVRAGSLATMHLEYFADTLLDPTVRKLLAPYVAQKL
ncbi:MAG: hypothetical protein LAN64_02385 [Acidobacteriia bacterium]|nr:hypothetical protein [Terriglobia bacterium]